MRNIKRAMLLATALGVTTSAMAHEAGDWLFRAGGTLIDPKSSNGTLDLGAVGLRPTGVDVRSQWGLTFNISYLMTDNWAVELLAALPYRHDIRVEGLPGRAATVTHLPPTLSVQYHFLPAATFQPYVGLGLNFTWFLSESKKGGLRAADELLEVNTGIDVDSTSFGLAVQAGFDYMLNERWFLNADLRWIDIDTKATLTADGAPVARTTVKIDPVVFGLNVGYRF